MTWGVLETILTIAISNQLTHLIYISNNAKGRVPFALPVKLVDASCNIFTNGELNLARYIDKSLPVINVLVDCPHTIQRKVQSFPWQVKGHVDYDIIKETVKDPLANPMLNLMVIGSVNTTTQVASYLGRFHMLKAIFSIKMNGISTNTSECHPASILRYETRTLLAEIDGNCQYRSKCSTCRISERFEGFGGRNFNIAYVDEKFFTMKRVANDSVTWSGYCFEIANALAAKMNFTYTILEPPDGVYGAKLNGTWVGMFGMLLRKEIAMILGPVTITAQRTEVVDFTYPYLEEDMVIGITIPPNSDGMFYIFNSLQWNIWLVIPITILVIGFATYLVQRWINCTDRTSIDGHIVLAFQAFTSQGSPLETKHPTQRIIIITVQLMVIVLAASFAGNLVAALATRQVYPPFTTLEELLQDSKYHVATTYGNAVHTFLKGAKSGLFSQFYQRVNSFNSDGDLKRRLKSGGLTAVICGKNFLNMDLAKTGICNLYVLHEALYPSWQAGVLPKGSPFLQAFSEKIVTLNEHGFLTKWRRHFDESNPCTAVDLLAKGDPRAVSLDDTAGILVILTAGIGFSTLVFGFEKCIYIFRTLRLLQLKGSRSKGSMRPSNLSSVSMSTVKDL